MSIYVCIERERETEKDYKEFVHTAVGAGKSKIYRQSVDYGRIRLQPESEGSLLAEFPVFWWRSAFTWRPSKRPTLILEDK